MGQVAFSPEIKMAGIYEKKQKDRMLAPDVLHVL
jgi:hypothetical protein